MPLACTCSMRSVGDDGLTRSSCVPARRITSLLRSGRLSHAFFFLSEGEEGDEELCWNPLLMDSVMDVRAAAQLDKSGVVLLFCWVLVDTGWDVPVIGVSARSLGASVIGAQGTAVTASPL